MGSGFKEDVNKKILFFGECVNWVPDKNGMPFFALIDLSPNPLQWGGGWRLSL